jgi:hypothetical protein
MTAFVGQAAIESTKGWAAHGPMHEMHARFEPSYPQEMELPRQSRGPPQVSWGVWQAKPVSSQRMPFT